MSVMSTSGRAGLSQLVASGLLFGAGAPIAGLLGSTAGLSPSRWPPTARVGAC